MVLLLLAGCGSSPSRRGPFDYGTYVASDPRSVVVAPVVGTVAGAEIEREFLTTITQPLAERGYYVFPVRMSKEFAAQAGFTGRGPSGGFEGYSEERAAELAALFGADSVLFVRIEQWDTRSEAQLRVDPPETTTVAIHYLLADERGQQLWGAEQQIAYTEAGSRDWLSAIFRGLWKLMTGTFMTAEQRQTQLAREANRTAIEGQKHKVGRRWYNVAPMLVGPYHVGYERDRARRRGTKVP